MRPVWELPLNPMGIVIDLENGTTVRIRPVRPGDKAALEDAFERLSQQSRYNRFFSQMPALPAALVKSFTEIDDVSQLAWVVTDPTVASGLAPDSGTADAEEAEPDPGLAIGAARIFPDAGKSTGEATLALVDDYQRRGIGRFLVELLISTAAMQNLDLLRFEVLRDNRGMRALMTRIGATPHLIPQERSALEYRLAIPASEDVDPTFGALYLLLRETERVATAEAEPLADTRPDHSGPDHSGPDHSGPAST